MGDMLDDLAYQIHKHLIEEATNFNGGKLVLIPITALVKRFDRNHRTIDRRLSALKKEGLLVPLIKKDYGTLFWVKEQDED
jgi:hypothetical protein